MTVDGLGNLDAGANGSLINNVSPDFLQEVKIQTSNFSAGYGRSTGAAFGIMTKTGTNGFHGAAFEYFRTTLMDARNFFSPNVTELRYNDPGWDLGGPVQKNKMFFFVGEEWKRVRQQAAPTRVTLPTTAELQGNFAGSGHTIDEPGTKTPFPDNIDPGVDDHARWQGHSQHLQRHDHRRRRSSATLPYRTTPPSKAPARSTSARTSAVSIITSATSTPCSRAGSTTITLFTCPTARADRFP